MTPTLRVLGIDGGFAKLGWAMLELGPDTENVVGLGVVSTSPSAKKRKVRAIDDNMRRIQEIATHLDPLVLWARAVSAEAMSFPRHAGSAAKMAYMYGVLGTLCKLHRVPLLQQTPQEVKKTVVGLKSASKLAVKSALDTRFSEKPRDMLDKDKVAEGAREHAYDALAAACACIGDDTIVGMRAMLGGL